MHPFLKFSACNEIVIAWYDILLLGAAVGGLQHAPMAAEVDDEEITGSTLVNHVVDGAPDVGAGGDSSQTVGGEVVEGLDVVQSEAKAGHQKLHNVGDVQRGAIQLRYPLVVGVHTSHHNGVSPTHDD